MTYFGMWRSFFAWHKEDADLLSINFLHFGATKHWYAISPRDQSKFDRLAKGIFPDLNRACPAFLRHKDILLSPTLLHAHGIPYIEVRWALSLLIALPSTSMCGGPLPTPYCRTFRVKRSSTPYFEQAKQEEGEFIVLNAAAYHSGFNTGARILILLVT